MNFTSQELSLLESWLTDESFVHWAREDGSDMVSGWDEYFDRNPQHRALGEAGRRLVKGIPFQDIPADDQRRLQALQNLMKVLDEKTDMPLISIGRSKHALWSRRRLATAAAVLVLIVSSLLYIQHLAYNPEVRLATTFGETLSATLPDGSVVTMNANSTLSYRRKTPRLVRLDGEAFFTVKKIPETQEKFQVSTQDLTITVLGTSFNVNSRDDQTKVFLEEGKVNLRLEETPTTSIEMTPGDLITYSKKQKKIMENRKSDALQNTSWKEGILFFTDTPLMEVLSKIEDIYGVTFKIMDPALQERLLTGGVPIQNLEITLETLQEVFGIEITFEGGRYLIIQ